MNIFRRHIYNDLRDHISKSEISLLTGSRQVGKTTLLKELSSDLNNQGLFTFFINLERLEYKKLLDENPLNLFSLLPPQNANRFIVFIDEIQYLNNPSNFLKLLFDEYKETIKLVVTGSSAFYIDRKFKDSLSGRKKIFHLSPFSFSEMVECRLGKEYIKYLQLGIEKTIEIPKIYVDRLIRLSEEYVIYGGYPKVVLESEYNEKQDILKELATSFLKKDAFESNIRKESEFMFFVEVLADRTGTRINRQELSNICNVSDETIQHFLYVLQKSFHIYYIRPFWKSRISEQRKMPKFYFQDNGMRNAILHDFSPIVTRSDKGELAENMLYGLLRHHFDQEQIQFWMNKDQKEVDFIINKKSAVEVKYSENLIKKGKYKLFTTMYPDMHFQFVTFKKSRDYKALWMI